MRHSVMLGLTLVAFWLLNSGYFTGLMLFLGAISVIFVVYIAHRMNVVDHEAQPLNLTTKIPGYLAWLMKEIVMSNITVIKHIWKGKDSISPSFTTIKVSQKTDMAKVIYANSITLTPGTVTVKIDDDTFLVHALVQETIDDLKSGEMDRRVTQLEAS